MSDRFTMSIGQAHELELAMDRAGGWSPTLVKELCKEYNLVLVRDLLLGDAEVNMERYVVNCDTDPRVLTGWKVEEHQKSGSFVWNHNKVRLYLSESQRRGEVIKGSKLRKELEGKPVLNASVLDYLLAHPYLIPEEWKRNEHGRVRYILFWGTIYRYLSDGSLGVRFLYWDDGWRYLCGCLEQNLGDDHLAVLRVLPPAEAQAA